LRCKFVVGGGAALDWALAAWHEIDPDLDLRPVALEQDVSYLFDLSALDALTPDRATVFVAYDNQFLNFRRFELMGQLKARGFSMPPLVCVGALVSSTATIGENALISPGAIIGHECAIGFNTVIGAGANIGSRSHIGSSAWIEAGVLIGRGARIGANATIGHGVIVGDAVDIGKLCVVDIPGKITRNIASKTFLHASFDTPITIVE
jgi:carbonic anhydrase/acetyltransferase-like protein (isoleucine patch superfamily)